jgi:hypothetical protein
MTLRNLYTLVALMLMLGLVFYFTQSDFESVSSGNSGSRVRLFENRNGEQVSTIIIEKANDQLEIKKSDKTWLISSKDNYPADAGKVGGLLLKLFDLQTSQRVPTSANSAETLGLAEESIEKDGYASISLLSAKGDMLGGLRIGKLRQKKKESLGGSGAGFSAAGQYVRRMNEEQIYVIGLPINVSAEAADWVQTSVLNAPSANVLSIEHFLLAADASELLFKLSRESTDDEFTLDGSVPDGEEIQSSVVSQLGSALENLRLIDVSKYDGEFKADRRVVYKLSNGAVYTVDTVSKGDNALGRLSVERDDEWISLLQSRSEKSSSDASKSESSDDSESTDSSMVDESETEESTGFVAVSVEEINNQNARFDPWVFEFPSYQAMKFRRDRNELFKKIDKHASASAS